MTHPERPQTIPVAEHIAHTLAEQGIGVWVEATRDDAHVQAQVQQADVVVAIGGDGAMLRAAWLCAPHGVPLLGLNMGKLGFLTEIATPDDWDAYLKRLLQGDYWIERRMMINVMIQQGDKVLLSGDALNDVVISGDRFGRMILLDAFIDGTWTTTYNSDALIIATPTGSTAYALAVGGPILPPQVQNILVVPAAAHLSMDRAMVLSEGAQVEVRLAAGNRHPVQVTLDGATFTQLDATATTSVCIRASQYVSQFLRMRPANYFYRSLLDRLEPRFNRNHANSDETSQDS